MRRRSPSRPGWAGASTRSCKRVSSRFPANCPKTWRSPQSANRSRRPTAARAARSSRRTSSRWTWRCPGSKRSRRIARPTARRRWRWLRKARQPSSATSPRRCWRDTATHCRSARFRSTAHGRSALRVSRSATSPTRFRCGTRPSASNATSASWSARTRRCARRRLLRSSWMARPPRSNR